MNGLKQDRGELMGERVSEGICDLSDTRDHLMKLNNYGLIGEELTLWEAYLKGRLNLCFCFGKPEGTPMFRTLELQSDTNKISQACGEVKHAVAHESCAQSKLIHEVSRHLSHAANGNDKFVLVCYVKGVNSVKKCVPTRIRLKGFDRVDDLFSGELHLSVLDGGFKSFNSRGEGELHGFRSWSFVAHHAEHNKIKGASEVMNRISENHGELIWNGYVCFDADGSLFGLWIIDDDECVRALRKIGVYFPVQVIDVVFGPINLKARKAQEALGHIPSPCTS